MADDGKSEIAEGWRHTFTYTLDAGMLSTGKGCTVGSPHLGPIFCDDHECWIANRTTRFLMYFHPRADTIRRWPLPNQCVIPLG